MKKFLSLALSCLFLMSCAISPKSESALPRVSVAQANDAVAEVRVETEEEAWTGTATFIAPTVAITAGHVCEKGAKTQLHMANGDVYSAEVLLEDDYVDWCVLLTDEPTDKYLKLDKNAAPEVGDKVWYFGYPGGFPGTFSGVVSGYEHGYIIVSIVGWYGASGSALLNEAGDVVGILSATYTENGSVLRFVPVGVLPFFLWSKSCPISL